MFGSERTQERKEKEGKSFNIRVLCWFGSQKLELLNVSFSSSSTNFLEFSQYLSVWNKDSCTMSVLSGRFYFVGSQVMKSLSS